MIVFYEHIFLLGTERKVGCHGIHTAVKMLGYYDVPKEVHSVSYGRIEVEPRKIKSLVLWHGQRAGVFLLEIMKRRKNEKYFDQKN